MTFCVTLADIKDVNFNLAVFEKNVEVLSYPCRRQRCFLRHCAKTLTFSKISDTTEDIYYLKFRLVVHYQKGKPYQ